MKIEPLSKEKLKQAINLIIKIFKTKPSDIDAPDKWLPLSLENKKEMKVDNNSICTYVKYYVGLDENSKKVIATTGIYTLKEDEKDSAWIAWYCLDSKFRGNGFGSQLLDFTIDLAKKIGKKYLKLYTSYNTDIKKAMLLYEKKGFKVIKKEFHPDTNEEMIYMTLKLK